MKGDQVKNLAMELEKTHTFIFFGQTSEDIEHQLEGLVLKKQHRYSKFTLTTPRCKVCIPGTHIAPIYSTLQHRFIPTPI